MISFRKSSFLRFLGNSPIIPDYNIFRFYYLSGKSTFCFYYKSDYQIYNSKEDIYV